MKSNQFRLGNIKFQGLKTELESERTPEFLRLGVSVWQAELDLLVQYGNRLPR